MFWKRFFSYFYDKWHYSHWPLITIWCSGKGSSHISMTSGIIATGRAPPSLNLIPTPPPNCLPPLLSLLLGPNLCIVDNDNAQFPKTWCLCDVEVFWFGNFCCISMHPHIHNFLWFASLQNLKKSCSCWRESILGAKWYQQQCWWWSFLTFRLCACPSQGPAGPFPRSPLQCSLTPA